MTDPEVEIILKLKSCDHYVTREELAAACGADRARIGEVIDDLVTRGYRIDEVPGEGYRLLDTPVAIDGSDIRTTIKGSVVGKEILTFGSIASTNDVASTLAKAGAVEGTVVVAEEQTRGRGRLGRGWHSPPRCGLWFSVILRPQLDAGTSTTVSLAGALGIGHALRDRYGIKTRIKWPNDVIVDSKKICGILTEGEFVENRVNFIVLGAGINVLNKETDFPPELRSIATSVALEIGRPVARSEVLAAVLEEMERQYLLLCNEGFGKIREELVAQSVLIGKVVRVKVGQAYVDGVAHDIDASGALIVRKESGSLERVIAGDVVGIA